MDEEGNIFRLRRGPGRISDVLFAAGKPPLRILSLLNVFNLQHRGRQTLHGLEGHS